MAHGHPRIRREVVGQMLDYAANALAYWPVDKIRSWAADRYAGTAGLNEALCRLLSPTSNEDPTDLVETYWQRVEENLRSGRVRLLFVADELPRELPRELPPAAKQLAAELFWVLYLYFVPGHMSPGTKRLQIKRVWERSQEPFPDDAPALEALKPGIGNPGTAYNTHRWREFQAFERE